MGIQINGNTDIISATDGSLTIQGADFTAVAAGSTAAPSISPTGDSNTGIFFPSADTIAFGEGGAEALRIDSSGNVGIGTNNVSLGKCEIHCPGTINHLVLKDTTNDWVSKIQVSTGGTFTLKSGDTEIINMPSTGRFRIKSPSNFNGEQNGRIEWWNENNSGIMAKISAVRESDGGAPTSLVFYTSANVDTAANSGEGDITERFKIDSSGKFYKNTNQIYPILQVLNETITSAVDLGSTTTTYTDIKTFGTFTPKKSGSLVYVMLQVQTWWGSTSNGNNTDVLGRLQQNSSGSYATFYTNDRLAGNFLYNQAFTHDTKHMIGTFTTSSTNSTSIKLQAMYSANNTAAFSFFHAGAGSYLIIEFDVA